MAASNSTFTVTHSHDPESQERADLHGTDFEPIFTAEQASDMESIYEANWGVSRRLMLLSLTRSRAELLDGFADNIEALVEMAEMVDGFRDHAHGMLEMAVTACNRLLSVAEDLSKGGVA